MSNILAPGVLGASISTPEKRLTQEMLESKGVCLPADLASILRNSADNARISTSAKLV